MQMNNKELDPSTGNPSTVESKVEDLRKRVKLDTLQKGASSEELPPLTKKADERREWEDFRKDKQQMEGLRERLETSPEQAGTQISSKELQYLKSSVTDALDKLTQKWDPSDPIEREVLNNLKRIKADLMSTMGFGEWGQLPLRKDRPDQSEESALPELIPPNITRPISYEDEKRSYSSKKKDLNKDEVKQRIQQFIEDHYSSHRGHADEPAVLYDLREKFGEEVVADNSKFIKKINEEAKERFSAPNMVLFLPSPFQGQPMKADPQGDMFQPIFENIKRI
jgi:hypothetical protein